MHHDYERSVIERDLAAGGFGAPRLETVAARSRAASARDAALSDRFGAGAIDGRMQAHVIAV